MRIVGVCLFDPVLIIFLTFREIEEEPPCDWEDLVDEAALEHLVSISTPFSGIESLPPGETPSSSRESTPELSRLPDSIRPILPSTSVSAASQAMVMRAPSVTPSVIEVSPPPQSSSSRSLRPRTNEPDYVFHPIDYMKGSKRVEKRRRDGSESSFSGIDTPLAGKRPRLRPESFFTVASSSRGTSAVRDLTPTIQVRGRSLIPPPAVLPVSDGSKGEFETFWPRKGANSHKGRIVRPGIFEISMIR